jgi:AmiR/NasT family two-component response regulator
MARHNLTEARAWRFIQTEAMNRHLKAHQVARLVLSGEVDLPSR